MYQRMKSLYPTRSLVKKGSPTSAHSLRVPQVNGLPGWLFLTHDDSVGKALFVDSQGKSESLPLVIDERLCSDTVLRVVRLSKSILVVYDILYLNGAPFHERMSYLARKTRLAELLELFHSPDLTALVHIDDIPVGTLTRGNEHYDEMPGSIGIFSSNE